MLEALLFGIWFLLPAAVANAAPVFGAHIPILKKWDTPLDFGKTWRGKEMFGAHKTWRGFVCGAVVSTIVLFLQQVVYEHTQWGHQIANGLDYTTIPLFVLGPLFALGALGGDAIESFFKRQIGIRSGGSWFPFDQIDYIIGGLIVTLPFIILPLYEYALIIIIWFLVHIIASWIGWLTGLKDQPI